MMRDNLLGGPPETFLPDNEAARAALAAAGDPAEVAARFPSYCAAWAALAERAMAAGILSPRMRSPGLATTAASTSYAGRAGRDMARSRGAMSRTRGSCGRFTRSEWPRPRSARTTRRPGARCSWPTAARGSGSAGALIGADVR